MMAGGEGGVKIFISFIHLGLATISIFDLTLYTNYIELFLVLTNKHLLLRVSTVHTRLNPLNLQPRQ